MKKSNSIKKKISTEDRTVSVNDPSKLLSEFFNSIVIQVIEGHTNES